MQNYYITLKIKGQIVHTVIYADSGWGARLLAKEFFGGNYVVGSPRLHTNESFTPLPEAIRSIGTKGTIKSKPTLTPPQARIASLQKQKDTVSTQLKVEKNQQKIQKAQQNIASARKPKTTE
jgi:hypothetical protein